MTKALALVVLASVDPKHPMRATAKVAPRLLWDLVELDRFRNPAAHGGRRPEKGDVVPTVEDAERLQRLAERAVGALLGIPPGGEPGRGQ